VATKFWLDLDLSSFEEELVFIVGFFLTLMLLFGIGLAFEFDKRIPDSEELLSNNGQHLNIDTVELVETCPAALLTKS
jgi:hypothetical protein